MKKWMAILLMCCMFQIACNDGGSGQSAEDEEFDKTYDNAVAFALSDENRMANAQAKASGGGGGGSGGGSFLWKPNSDSNGRLVILLPSSYASVSSITIRGSFGSRTSNRSAIGNGGRPHYRFPMTGGSYGSNITVSGGGSSWHVRSGGSRTEL